MSAFATTELPYNTDQDTIAKRKEENNKRFDTWLESYPVKLTRACKNSIRGRINYACVNGEEVIDFEIYLRDWQRKQMTYAQKWPVRKLSTVPNNFEVVDVDWEKTREYVKNVQVDNYNDFRELFDKREDEKIIQKLFEAKNK